MELSTRVIDMKYLPRFSYLIKMWTGSRVDKLTRCSCGRKRLLFYTLAALRGKIETPPIVTRPNGRNKLPINFKEVHSSSSSSWCNIVVSFWKKVSVGFIIRVSQTPKHTFCTKAQNPLVNRRVPTEKEEQSIREHRTSTFARFLLWIQPAGTE